MEPTFGFYALTPILRCSSLFVRNDVIHPRITPKTTYCSEDTSNSMYRKSSIRRLATAIITRIRVPIWDPIQPPQMGPAGYQKNRPWNERSPTYDVNLMGPAAGAMYPPCRSACSAAN